MIRLVGIFSLQHLVSRARLTTERLVTPEGLTMGGRRTALAAAFGAGWLLALSSLLVSPASAADASCPAPPYTLAKIGLVPETQRAACLGRTEITFVAIGGQVQAVIPGVMISASFGNPMWFQTGTEGLTSGGWKRLDLDLGHADQTAFDHTDPGGLDGWMNVWWRVTGHFNDPASSDCRSAGDAQYPYTAAQAVAFCRNLFVIDGLTWLPTPPTDTAPAGAGPSGGQGPVGSMGLLAVTLVAVLVAGLVLERRRSPARPGPPG